MGGMVACGPPSLKAPRAHASVTANQEKDPRTVLSIPAGSATRPRARRRSRDHQGRRGSAMCGQLGMGELIVLLLIVVVVFGAGKLPQVGEALGRSVKNFKKAVNTNDEIDVSPKKEL